MRCSFLSLISSRIFPIFSSGSWEERDLGSKEVFRASVVPEVVPCVLLTTPSFFLTQLPGSRLAPQPLCTSRPLSFLRG